MTDPYHFYTSVTRCSDLWQLPFDVSRIDRSRWAPGDLVVGEVTGERHRLYRCETKTGRMAELVRGYRVVGALGVRCATLEGVGDWRAVGPERELDALTGAGLLGKATSTSPMLPDLMGLIYRGHVCRDQRKVTMSDFVPAIEAEALNVAVVLIIGTSMSAGKTASGQVIIRELKALGCRVTAAKLTGAARYRDILCYRDAGADAILDFVDAGLPSTVCSAARFDAALGHLAARINATHPDVLVAEAGASPLEPYNGALAMERLRNQTRMIVLCASDPYAALGVREAFGIEPDLVSGPAANTDAAVSLVGQLVRLPALNLLDHACRPHLRGLLRDRLGLPPAGRRGQ